MNYPTRELEAPFGKVMATFHPDHVNLSVGHWNTPDEHRRIKINGIEYKLDMDLKLVDEIWDSTKGTYKKRWRKGGSSIHRGEYSTSQGATDKARGAIYDFADNVIACINNNLYEAEFKVARQAELEYNQARLKSKIAEMQKEILRLENELKEIANA